jgi:hypothetical protein
MKKPKSNAKPRNTLAKEIRKAVRGGSNATELAMYGRRLSSLEKMLEGYFSFAALLKLESAGRFTDPRKWTECSPSKKAKTGLSFSQILENFQLLHKQHICAEIMAAVDSGDFQKIRNFADAVRFFKINRFPNRCDADSERFALLALAGFHRPELGLNPPTIREVAAYVVWFGKIKSGNSDFGNFNPDSIKIDTPADGFSALRRKCKEVGLPIAPSKRKPARQINSK